ncbi:anhydro-N-acetylmuramic acid kinase [Lysobacter sp. yr284]|uniref:anhydro-N-acetylmuramic acid kinase n=1 Tax=Lysobacter sp. yr284 TaxID=1761791 RepID=UPI0008958958|nr:anhydro-N-acetylmuramic acid kinase [Lysobacter sp. yr284]SDZ18364.1 anhydro-N-acetylmuramic acid kinase [Lysobacter sp. yr284]
MVENSSIPAGGNAAAPGAGLYLGLISGTSADGIDAALVRFEAGAAPTRCELVLGRTYAWDAPLRERLVALGQGGDARSLEELGTLDIQTAEAFAAAARALLAEAGVAPADVAAIGSHGQTVRHRPAGAAYDGRHPFTWQIGDGSVIAERCGIATVADFRRRDVAAGGHGAPLMPAFHAALLGSPDEDRAALNLGGIANFTLLPAHGAVRGFDTGPANCLMDAWALRHLGVAFDADGAFAAGGEVDPALLARLLDEPWFALPPPKSTGREQFQLDWVESRLGGGERPQDVQATLLELSAVTIAQALRAQQPATRRVLACGGGVRNGALLARLAARLPGVAVETTQAYGLDPDFVEAMGFAWLARQTLAGQPGNLPSVTGARGLRVLGTVHPA